jgi:uncharacterized membrane protein
VAGLIVALVFLAASLIPGLLPRPWQVQGVVSAIAVSLGYGVGSAVAGLWHGWSGDRPRRRGTTLPLRLTAGALVVWASVIHGIWRADIAALMDVELPLFPYVLLVLVTAAVAGFLLIQLGRGIGFGLRRFRRLLTGWFPGWLASGVTALIALTLLIVFFDQVVAGQLVPALEKAHRSSDQRFEPGVTPPESAVLAGGPRSLIDWETMGSQGRDFVAQAPTPSELEAFSAASPPEPIRLYVGLETAPDAESRAMMAVEEMERVGAFDRDAVVLIAPTGSGWIDPHAVEGIEFLYNGNTASVAVQYSYLASWMVMIGNQDLAIDAARSLLTAVTGRIEREPEEERPLLLIYGESLGAFAWERLFDDLEDVTATVDGALLVGPPRSGPLWQQLVRDRDLGSPLWRPVYRGGETVRFGAGADDLSAPEGRWNAPRVAYLQHASDPITWWTPELMIRRPDWLDEPGPDISRYMPYLPVVTFWQMAVDLAVGTNATIGHGHKFGAAQTEAWSMIVPPPGWTSSQTERLVALLEK